MKLNENFALRSIAGTWVVLPLADKTVNFNGIIKLNDSGVLLWRALENGADLETLADTLTNEYDVTRETALADVDEFLNNLRKIGCIE